MAIYTILNSSIRAFSKANSQNTVLNIFSVTFDAIFTYYCFEFKKALCNSPKIVQHKKCTKNVQLKTLKPVLSQFPHIYVSVLSLLQPKEKSYIRKAADGSPQHLNIVANMILYFHFLFKLTKTEVLIYRYVDRDSQTYSYKNVPQTCAANLQEGPCWRVPP